MLLSTFAGYSSFLGGQRIEDAVVLAPLQTDPSECRLEIRYLDEPSLVPLLETFISRFDTKVNGSCYEPMISDTFIKAPEARRRKRKK